MASPVFAVTYDGIRKVGPGSSATVQTGGGTDPLADRGLQTTNSEDYYEVVAEARTEGGAGLWFRRGTGSTYANFTLVTDTGANALRLTFISSDTCVAQRWNGSTWADVAPPFTVASQVSSYLRMNFSGCGTLNGAFAWKFVTTNEDMQAEGSVEGIDLTAVPNVSGLRAQRFNSSDLRFGSMFIRDGGAMATYIYGSSPNANGADVDGSGTYSSLTGSGSTYDQSFISLPATGNRRSVKNSANRNYGARGIVAMGFSARLRCGETGPTQCRAYLTIGGVRYYLPTRTLTTSFEPYTFVWPLNPATGAAWLTADAQNASLEYGIEAV